MRRFRLTYFILAAGIFILIFSTLLGTSITSKYSEINGLYKTNKVSAHLLDDKSTREDSAFTIEDIKHLERFSLKNMDMAYAAENKALAVYENNQTQANVFGISDKYNQFHQIQLKSGSFITSGNKNEMVAVVDENLAMELFNSSNVIGMYAEIYNQRFKIIGVINPDESIVQTLADNGYGNIYIPVEHMLKYEANSKITAFELRAANMGTTGKNINFINEALASIGKNASDFKIVDYNNERILIEEKALIGIFIPGIAAIVLLLLSLKKKVLNSYATVSNILKENYLGDVIKKNYIKMSLIILEVFALLAFVYLIWKVISFNIYIPPEYIPDELIDIKFFSELTESLLQNNVLNTGYVPTITEMKLNILSLMQNWDLFVYILIGFPLYCLGLKLLELDQEGIIRKLLYCCAFLSASIILSLFILYLFKMPATVNLSGMLIIFIFIFLSVIKSDKYFNGSNQNSM